MTIQISKNYGDLMVQHVWYSIEGQAAKGCISTIVRKEDRIPVVTKTGEGHYVAFTSEDVHREASPEEQADVEGYAERVLSQLIKEAVRV